jgi:hypothetical protein
MKLYKFITTTSLAMMISCLEAQSNPSLHKIYTKHKNTAPSINRAMQISATFIGAPYSEFLLGDGPNSNLSPKPIYRLDKFDCITYVETVLALTYTTAPHDFNYKYKDIKYKEGKYDFFHRNHFTNIDWNKNAQTKGYLTDITTSIVSRNSRPLAITAATLIDIPSWYNKLGKDANLWHKYTGVALTNEARQQLIAHANNAKPVTSTIKYIPTKQLLNSSGKLNYDILKTLPKITVVEIVRTNWDIKKHIGTNLDISHIGFLINDGKTIKLRHASETHGKVVEVSLSKYLAIQSKQQSFAGLNIQKINLN